MKRISDKKLAKLGGKVPFSTISSKPKRIRKRPRKPSETLRIYGGKKRIEWVKAQPCICATTRCVDLYSGSENAHIRTGGTGRKADYTLIVPLCRFHHEKLHSKGVIWFENIYMFDLDAEAERVERAWQESQR